jgi:hypothetical protein
MQCPSKSIELYAPEAAHMSSALIVAVVALTVLVLAIVVIQQQAKLGKVRGELIAARATLGHALEEVEANRHVPKDVEDRVVRWLACAGARPSDEEGDDTLQSGCVPRAPDEEASGRWPSRAGAERRHDGHACEPARASQVHDAPRAPPQRSACRR